MDRLNKYVYFSNIQHLFTVKEISQVFILTMYVFMTS